MSKKIKAIDHENYITYTLIAIVIPLVGIIVGAMYLGKDETVDKKFGEHLVAISALFMIIWGVAWVVLAGGLLTNSMPTGGY